MKSKNYIFIAKSIDGYIADKNGFNLRLLVDMKSSNSCCGAGEVFWSPDENKVAFKACNNFKTCFFVYNARYGTMLGYICSPNQNFTIYNTYLCGWSPDGKWLLYYQYLDPAQGYLCKVAVTPEGKIDQQSAKVLMSNVRISGATWGKIVQQ